MDRLADVMSLIIFISTTPCTIGLCASLFLIDMVILFTHIGYESLLWLWQYCFSLRIIIQLDTISEMCFPIIMIAAQLQSMMMYFFFGQLCHSNLMDLGDSIYESKWPCYPRRIQMYVLMIIMRTQHPFYISAYGIILCTLENSVNVSPNNIYLLGFGCNQWLICFRSISGTEKDLHIFHGIAKLQII